MKHRILNIILDIAIFTIVAIWLAPPVEPVKYINYAIVGFLHGLLTVFITIISLFNPKVTPNPTYIIDMKYWIGYYVGILAFAGGIGYQMRKMYNWQQKNNNRE